MVSMIFMWGLRVEVESSFDGSNSTKCVRLSHLSSRRPSTVRLTLGELEFPFLFHSLPSWVDADVI